MENRFCLYCMTPTDGGAVCPKCGQDAGFYTPAVYHLPPGTVLKERYLIGRALGEGGFGITYIGCDLRLELRVAIKEYFPTDKVNRISKDSLSVSCYAGSAASRYAEGKEQFLQEALTLAKMDKQSVIVGVRDFFEENNTAYIVMEYVDGTTFKELTKQRGGHIPLPELMETMEPLFSALSAMHAQGLIHRDISPENLMLENGEIRLLDFGCARESQNGDTTLTVAMKHGYAPVEQYQNKGQGPWTDVYALSATIYFCLTGIKPPRSMDRLVEDELIPPRKLGVDLTERQERVILRGMGIRPRRRFQSVQELYDALYKDGECEISEPAQVSMEPEEEEQPRPVSVEQKPSGKERPILFTACAVAAVALLILLGVFVRKPASNIPETKGPTGLALGGPFDGVARLSADANENELRGALTDERVPAVVIPTGVGLEISGEPLEVTKPLLIESGAEVYAFQPVTVSGAGVLRVEGKLENFALLRAEQGGRLETGAAGQLNVYTFIWLENEGDMTVESGGSAQIMGENWRDAPGRLLILDEEALFKDAVHVTTLEEYDRYRLGSVPIVIDADICFTAYNRSHVAPVCIREGVTVTAPVTDQGYCAWDVSGTFLINHGTIRGRVVSGDWDNDGISDVWKILNFGTIDGGFFTQTGAGLMVNLGTLQGDGDAGGGFYNLGAFIPADFYIRNGHACNMGQIQVGGSSAGRLELAGMPFGFGNSGNLAVGENGELRNYATLRNYGRLTATADTASFWNMGYLCNVTAGSQVDMHPDSTLIYDGVFQYGADTVLNLSNNRIDYGGSTVAFRWGGTAYRAVRTEAELHMALSDETCGMIVIDGVDIAVDGDLTCTKGVAIGPSGSLTVSGGNLTVSGDNAFLLGDCDLSGGRLILLGGANAIGNPAHCGGLTIRDSRSKLVTNSDFSPESGAEIELSDGGFLIALRSLGLEKASVYIGRWSVLRSGNGLWMESCSVEIGEEGTLQPACSGYYLDKGTTVVNYGFLREEETWSNQDRELSCGMTNYGWMELRSGSRISGSIANHGTMQISGTLTLTGTVDNRGDILLSNGEIQTEEGGALTGRPAEHRTTWTVPE